MGGYRAKKRLGQHFLTSDDIIRQIVDSISPKAGDRIIEVGPGRGALTVGLAESGAQVTAVEFDRDMIERLNDTVGKQPNVTIIQADFLMYEPNRAGFPSFKLIGNLPYNISSPVLDWCAHHTDRIDRAVFMVQREVAHRVASTPGGKDWSPLAIFMQLLFDIRLLFDVSPKHFTPPPEVWSTVFELVPKKSRIEVPDGFEKLVRAAFAQRRKTLVNNLVPDIGPDAEQIRKILLEMSLTPTIRAEQLSIDQFLTLTGILRANRLL